MNPTLIIIIVLCVGILLFCLFRLGQCLYGGKIRALTHWYPRKDEPAEFFVWVVVYIALGIACVAGILLVGAYFAKRSSSDVTSEAHLLTSLYTQLILVLQFCALIAFIPFMVRFFKSSSKKKSPKKDSKLLILQIRDSCESFEQARVLLKDDYLLETEHTMDGVTTATFVHCANTASLLRIEYHDDESRKILDLY